MNKKIIYLNKTGQIIVCLFLIIVQLIATFRPLTNFPDEKIIVTPEEFEMAKTISMSSILGSFGGQFGFLTTWVNLLAIVTILLSWLFNIKINVYWKNALMVYLLIIFGGFFLLIAPFLKWGQGLWTDFIFIHQHLLIVVIGVWWYCQTNNYQNMKLLKSILITLSIPIIYFVFIFIIYCVSNFKVVPYTFLYFQNVLFLNLPLAFSIILTITILIVIIILHIVMIYLFVYLNRYKFCQRIEKK